MQHFYSLWSNRKNELKDTVRITCSNLSYCWNIDNMQLAQSPYSDNQRSLLCVIFYRARSKDRWRVQKVPGKCTTPRAPRTVKVDGVGRVVMCLSNLGVRAWRRRLLISWTQHDSSGGQRVKKHPRKRRRGGSAAFLLAFFVGHLGWSSASSHQHKTSNNITINVALLKPRANKIVQE